MKGLRWHVQDGKSISFREDKWITLLPSFAFSSNQPMGCEVKTVADVIDKGIGGWKRELQDQLVSEEEAQAILAICVSLFQREDV